MLRSVRLFDRYAGPPLGAHEISLGFRLRFEPADRPIDEAELDERIAGIVSQLWDRLGARLRA
jgi:phenylalanyl-tRNA synthetase beta subunit